METPLSVVVNPLYNLNKLTIILNKDFRMAKIAISLSAAKVEKKPIPVNIYKIARLLVEQDGDVGNVYDATWVKAAKNVVNTLVKQYPELQRLQKSTAKSRAALASAEKEHSSNVSAYAKAVTKALNSTYVQM